MSLYLSENNHEIHLQLKSQNGKLFRIVKYDFFDSFDKDAYDSVSVR